MMKFATLLAAAMLAGPALSFANDKSDFCAKSSSFVPHPHAKHHVYGAPIGPAIVGHRKNSHHVHPPQKQS